VNLGGTSEEFVQSAVQFVPRLIAALVAFGASLLLSGLVARWVLRSAVVCAILEAAERAGIELPYPIQTVRLEGDFGGLRSGNT
jgi:hypothetical protein